MQKERSRAVKKARPNHKRRRARTKERALERASRRKVSLLKKRQSAKAKARKVSQVENPAKNGKVHVETVLVTQTREIHTLFEHLVAEAGLSCLYSCHQWHRVEEAVYYGLPESATFRVNASHAIALMTFTDVNNKSILVYFFK